MIWRSRNHYSKLFVFLCLAQHLSLATGFIDEQELHRDLDDTLYGKAKDLRHRLRRQLGNEQRRRVQEDSKAMQEEDAATNNDNEDDDDDSISAAIGALFEWGVEIAEETGIFSSSSSNGDDDDNNDQNVDENPVTDIMEELGVNTTTNASLNFADGILVFDSGEIFSNITLDFGMDEVASYFGIDSSDPQEVQAFVESFGNCQFCDSNQINHTLAYAGMACSDWQMFSLFAKDEECAVLRAAAVEHCACQPKQDSNNYYGNHKEESASLEITPETPTCDLCPDGSLEKVDMEQKLPTMSDALMCGDIAHVKAVEGDKTCEAVAGFGYICGCPDVQPACHVCDDGSAAANPDAILQRNYKDKRTGETLDLTCAVLNAKLQTTHTQSTCSLAKKDVARETGKAVSLFCGCANAEPLPKEKQCAPCPTGYRPKRLDEFMAKENLDSCHAWMREDAPYRVAGDQCRAHQEEMLSQCCARLEGFNDDTGVMVGRSATSSSAAPAPAARQDFNLFVAFQVAMLIYAYFR